MAEVDSSLIRQGFWINHSQGVILGSTITIDERAANAVVALVAIVISIGLNSAWNLTVFAYHQCRATAQPMDGLFRQQQVFFRTMPGPGSTFAESVKLLWRWRPGSRPAALSSVYPAVAALLFSLGSLAAGVFSSNIVTGSDVEVLVTAASCVNFNFTAFTYTRLQNAETYQKDAGRAASTFGSQCYNTGPLPTVCNFYVHPRIDFSTSFEQSPFSPNMSLTDSTRAIVLDSGYLDSNDIFGINAPQSDRIQFRRRASCIPLNMDEHMRLYSAEQILKPKFSSVPLTSLPGEQYWVFKYGEGIGGFLPDNSTLAHSTYLSNRTQSYTAMYSVHPENPMLSPYDAFIPLEGLRCSNADVGTLFVATNAVCSLKPIDGPIYSSHRFIHGKRPTRPPCYGSDEPGGVLGCTEQYDFCIQPPRPDAARECTGLGGARWTGFNQALPHANPAQLATMRLFGTASTLSGYSTVLSAYEAGIDLKSTFAVIAGIVPGLPSDQWALDIQSLEGFAWAYLQLAIVNHFTGYPGAHSGYLDKPSPGAEAGLCHNQKVIKSGGFANINVFGMSFTLAFSALLVVLDYLVLRLGLLSRRARKILAPKLDHWIADGLYQVQRAAYQEMGAGTWTGGDEEIPLCTADDRLEELPPCPK